MPNPLPQRSNNNEHSIITMTKYSYIVGLFVTAGLIWSSCSSLDEDVSNASQEKVVAQFSLSVSGKNATRMSGEVVQATNAFLGMQEISLIPFAKGVAANEPDEPIAADDNSLGLRIALPDLGVSDLQANNKSKLYSNVLVPVGTNAFLVYGRSAHADNAPATNGKIVATGLDGSPAGMTFSLQPICSEVTTNGAAGETGNNIIAYLNTVFAAREGVFDWSSSSYPILNGLYDLVKDMKAGASASVQAFVQEIYEILKPSASTEYVQNVLKAILVEHLVNGELPETLPDVVTLPSDCEGYPADCGLPDGTAVIQWNETNKRYEAVTSQNNLGAMNVDVTNFTYPAELWYRSNSRINTDYESRAADYATQATWDGVLGTYLKQISTVEGATRSIAVRRQLQYAVGRLDLRLEAKATEGGTTTVLTELKDKAGTSIPVNKLTITGILVGQQSPVDFKFQSKGSNDYTIYDNSAIVSSINPDADAFSHTLVLETQKNQSVNVAVELLNNSGYSIVTGSNDDIVPPGCKFYVIGQLNPVDVEGYNQDNDIKNRVFCQDHVTKVTLTVTDLTKGYYVIPPLRSAQLEFSLAVANWKISTSVGGELEYNED